LIAIKRQDHLFGGGSGNRVEALAAQQCVDQELAAHGNRICDQDSSPQDRIGDGFQQKLNTHF
jgi:hypothetical protein